MEWNILIKVSGGIEMKKVVMIILFVVTMLSGIAYGEASKLIDIDVLIGQNINLFEFDSELSGSLPSDLVFKKDIYGRYDVSASGVITGLKDGDSLLHVYSKTDSSFYRIYNIKVKKNITSINFKYEKVKVIPAVSYKIDYDLNVIDDKIDNNNYLTWVIGNPLVVEVDKNGYIVAKKPGVTTVTLQTKDGSISDSFIVEAIYYAKSIKITELEKSELQVGEKLQLKVKVQNGSETYEKAIYESSDPNVAFIDENGVVTGKGDGNVTITAYSLDKQKKDSVKIKVYSTIYNVKIIPEYTKINDLEPHKLSYTYNIKSGKKPLVEGFTWSSSDAKVIDVDQQGNLKVVTNGTVTISLKSMESSYRDDAIVIADLNNDDIAENADYATRIVLQSPNKELIVGEKYKLNIDITPIDYDLNKLTIRVNEFTSDEISIENGSVYYTPKKEGNSIITVYSGAKRSSKSFETKSIIKSFKIDIDNMVKTAPGKYLLYNGQTMDINYGYTLDRGYDIDDIYDRTVALSTISGDKIEIPGIYSDKVKAISTGEATVVATNYGDRLSALVKFEIQSALTGVYTKYEPSYDLGTVVDINAKPVMKQNLVYDLEDRYQFEYDAWITDQYVDSNWINNELKYEEDAINAIEGSSSLEEGIKLRWLKIHDNRRKMLLALKDNAKDGFSKLETGIILTDRNGDVFKVAYISNNKIVSVNPGKVALITKEEGSSISAIDYLIFKEWLYW